MFTQLLLFFLSIFILLFLPGFFLLLAIFKKNITTYFIPLEIATISFITSLISFDFLIIFFAKIGLNINRVSILVIVSLFIAGCYSIFRLKNKLKENHFEKINTPKFNSTQSILIILILFLTIFIKTVYLKDTIFPTSTDLGHHMYWAKLTSETGRLPDYRKNEIIPTGSDYLIQSEPIADFIIGEHLIFSGINILTKIPYNSYFPSLILFLINIFSLLAMFILALRIFDNKLLKNNLPKIIINPVNLSILTLFLIGPFYAVTSPQAKFVSGGVIGNVIGNMLIPMCLYFFFRALKEKDSWMLFLGLLLSAGLFYTHHLSGFVFLFIIFFIFIIFNITFVFKTIKNSSNKIKSVALNYRNIFYDLLNIFLKPQIILFFVVIILFLFFIYTPSYLSASATSTAVGAPSKSTRAGLTLNQFKYSIGEIRLVFGMIGLIILSILPFIKRKSIVENSYLELLLPSILGGWSIALFLMTTHPNWLHINLPSDRVANYANFPFIILSSLGVLYFIFLIKRIEDSFFISKRIIYLIFIFTFTTLSFLGYYDNSQSLSNGPKNQKALKTFHVSEFLANQMRSNDIIPSNSNILKDHNYITSDSWMKLSFSTDYNYPLSRGYFKRYSDPTKPREMCTLWMISEPSSERAKKCFDATKTKYIIIDTSVDEPQFKANPNFYKVYESDSLSVFAKKDKLK